MKLNFFPSLLLFSLVSLYGLSQDVQLAWNMNQLGYHSIKLDPSDHSILPWYNDNPAIAYDFVIKKIWDFWESMRRDMNGLPYYMNHQVWQPDFNDWRGIGGDQFAMALSSWQLLYNYTGNESVKENMKFIADYYLTHSLSPSNAVWPHIPYPYNTLIYSGVYDGDMILGKDITQPDKAGSFGFELTKLYKMTGFQGYLDHAVSIANTLAAHMKEGDNDNSPMPFRVNAITGQIGRLKSNKGDGSDAGLASYTTNYSGTLELFLVLEKLNAGNPGAYRKAFNLLLSWMKKYPLKTNKWGPFFEDIPGWSDTQINAVTFAQFIMNHREYFPDWGKEVAGIFDWVYKTLENKEWEKYGVIVVNEQTAYQVPGNSHTSRQASTELQYIALTGDSSRYLNVVRQLNWATYMVDWDGKNRYPRDDVWMTDGYGDYVRHYLRAMAVDPRLSPSNENHILFSTTILSRVRYRDGINKFSIPEIDEKQVSRVLISYFTFDAESEEVIRMTMKPSSILVGEREILENSGNGDTWYWKSLPEGGGILTIRHVSGKHVIVLK